MGRFPTRADVILNRFELFKTDLLGAGSESSVYAMDAGHVLRIYRDHVPWEYVNARQAFYAEVAQQGLPFAVPEVYSVGAWVGHVYATERRIAGQDFGQVLRTLSGEARTKALSNYLDAAAAIGAVCFPDKPYGELILDPPLQSDSWQAYLAARMEGMLARSRTDLMEDVPDFEAVLASIYARLPLVCEDVEKRLVHGDYCPNNVMIDDALQITGVVDFSYATVVGDPRLDIAGAMLFVETTSGHEPDDVAFLRGQVRERWGEAMLEVVDFYRLYYSIYFSGCKADDPSTYWWCVRNLRAAVEG
jgi:aminoglycoside phosphotransferase (APT) family kinase protein